MTAAGNSLDQPYLKHLAGVSFQPVFIMGLHRSGTTILYQLLYESGCFNVTTFFHLLNHQSLLYLHFTGEEQEARQQLSGSLDRLAVRDRGYDEMQVTPDTLHEYCYALRHQGRRPMLTSRNLESFDVFCRKIQLIQQPGRPLLLKNPFDTLNFLGIWEAFPNARFIFIHRNPVEIINSQIHSIRSVLQKKNEFEAMVIERYRRFCERPALLALARWIYSERFPLLYHQVARYIARNCDYMTRNVEHLGDAYTGLSYAELCDDPAPVIRRVLDFLGLRERTTRDYQGSVRPRRLALIPEVEAHRRQIEQRNAAYCRRFGV